MGPVNVVCGIYGYHITRPIDLPGLRIEPRTDEYMQAKLWARNPNSYQLTAILKGTSISNDLLYNLEAILSFVEHLDVLITLPVKKTEEDPFALFPPIIPAHQRGDGGGAVIRECFPTPRSSFISKALDRLHDQQL